MIEAGLYIHIPFCEKKCDYCDFYSITRLEQIDGFVQALQTEIEIRAQYFRNYTFKTMFWGGGTPSLLNEKQITQILDRLKLNFHFNDEAEITIEANPGTLTSSKLYFLKKLGFNRLSLGAQSFNPHELNFLGRIHSVNEIYKSYNDARDAGFSNINIDLMAAFPSITLRSFKNSLSKAVQLKPEHISCYTLIFEPRTVFYKKMQRGELMPIDGDEEASYYEIASKILQANGYLHYEISNFSLGEKHICKHNLSYWEHKTYLGLGPSAHSFFQNQRQANKRSLLIYINELNKGNLPIDFQENLSEEDLISEYIFLNLRLRRGINLNDFQNRFGRDYIKKFSSKIQYLSDNKLVEANDHYLKLTDRGWMLADYIAASF
jgi:oxygen-independent coproporphyrinogen-3 oxidase